jgi:hypothetical protein
MRKSGGHIHERLWIGDGDAVEADSHLPTATSR